MKNKEKKNSSSLDALLIVFLILSALSLICLFTRNMIFGDFGVLLADFILGIFGFSAYVFSGLAMVLCLLKLFASGKRLGLAFSFYTCLVTIGIYVILHLLTSSAGKIADGLSFSDYVNESYKLTGGGFYGSTFGGALAASALYYVVSGVRLLGTYIFAGLVAAGGMVGMVSAILKRSKAQKPQALDKGDEKPLTQLKEESDDYDIPIPKTGRVFNPYEEQFSPKKDHGFAASDRDFSSKPDGMFVYDAEKKPKDEMEDAKDTLFGKGKKKGTVKDLSKSSFDGESWQREEKVSPFNMKVEEEKSPYDQIFRTKNLIQNAPQEIISDDGAEITPPVKGSFSAVTPTFNQQRSLDEKAKQEEKARLKKEAEAKLREERKEYAPKLPDVLPEIITDSSFQKMKENEEKKMEMETSVQGEEVKKNTPLSREDFLKPRTEVDFKNILPYDDKVKMPKNKIEIITSVEQLRKIEMERDERDARELERFERTSPFQERTQPQTQEPKKEPEIFKENFKEEFKASSYYEDEIENSIEKELASHRDRLSERNGFEKTEDKTPFDIPFEKKPFEKEDREPFAQSQQPKFQNGNAFLPKNRGAFSDSSQVSLFTDGKEKPYVFPPLELLKDAEKRGGDISEDVELKARKLESVLDDFKIPCKVVETIIGPTVTVFELEIPQGIQVKRIESYEKDISLWLESPSDVIIQAPIPGKNRVGIEVPNKIKEMVSLKEVMSSENFKKRKGDAVFALGKDSTGRNIVCDIKRMPHLLISGATGMGKSVCLNTIIVSFLYNTTPDDVRLILIDPKKVEFNIYRTVPHLMVGDIISDSETAVAAFDWAVTEMERRYTLLEASGFNDLDSFNKFIVKEGKKKLPKIVIVVDEVADLISMSKKEIETKIQRIAQKARAAGIHLVLATQRPSVDVITGVIKTNLPSRIAFKLSNGIDSKTVLDEVGAEKLLGNGDMFYKPSDFMSKLRVQGAFVSMTEVRSVVDFVSENNETYYDTSAYNQIFSPKRGGTQEGYQSSEAVDEKFVDAVRVALLSGSISTSMIQRKLGLGFSRAGKIIDLMESLNYVSKMEGNKPRQVLIDEERFERDFGEKP